MAVSMADITHLRKMTGAGMMDCKNALTEANSDFDTAMEIIRKRGQAIAAKRSDRDAAEGCVLAQSNGDFAAVVALKCETDFVAKNSEFMGLTQLILDTAMANKPATTEELLAIEIEGRSIQTLITDRIGVTGEKMEIGFYEFVNGATTVAYIHPGNKLGTIVAFNQADVCATVARDIAMQVAAMAPVAVCAAEVCPEIVAKELAIAADKAREAGKPENLIDRIAQGSLQKYYQENTLLSQSFVKENKMTIDEYLKKQDKDLTVVGFKRANLNVE